MLNFLKSMLSGGAGKSIGPQAYKTEFEDAKKPHTLIDVRTVDEFKSGHVPRAVNIDVQVIAQRLKDIPKDKPVVLYCRSGNRSGQAASILQQAGYTEIYNLGGIGAWRAAGYSIK